MHLVHNLTAEGKAVCFQMSSVIKHTGYF